MSGDVVVLVGIAVVAILGAVAAFTIAWRRSGGGFPELGRETRAADRSAPVQVAPPVTPVAAETQPEPAPVATMMVETEAVAVARVQRVVEVSPEEAGVSRRMFLNRALGLTFLVGFGGTLSLAFLDFLWPRIQGGFGSDVVAGAVNDLLASTRNADGSVTPVFLPEARAYVVPAPATVSAQFEGKSVAAGGVMALYQRCVHLGCRVPWCQTSQGFECPCHGSKYNGIGEYFGGPAPRNLDRFVVEVSDSGVLTIKTGSIVETPRAIDKSVEYPQGVACI